MGNNSLSGKPVEEFFITLIGKVIVSRIFHSIETQEKEGCIVYSVGDLPKAS